MIKVPDIWNQKCHNLRKDRKADTDLSQKYPICTQCFLALSNTPFKETLTPLERDNTHPLRTMMEPLRGRFQCSHTFLRTDDIRPKTQ